MSITNPFNFGPRIGSVGMNFTGKSPEVMASGKKKWLVPPSPLAPGIPDDNPNPPFSPGGSGGPGLVGGSDFWNPPNPLDDQLGGGGGGGQSYGGVRTRFSNVLNPMWYPSEPPHPLKCTTWDGSSGEIYKLSEGGIITTYVDAGKTQHCCTKRQVSDIVNAFTSLTSELDTVSCLSLFPGLYDCILDTWSNSKLKIICVPNSNSRSRTSPPIIALSNNYWSSHTYAANRFETIKALLLHELVHL